MHTAAALLFGSVVPQAAEQGIWPEQHGIGAGVMLEEVGRFFAPWAGGQAQAPEAPPGEELGALTP